MNFNNKRYLHFAQRYLIFLFLFSVFVENSFPQPIDSEYKMPKLYIEVSGAYSFPTNSLKGGSFSEYYSFSNYAMNTGVQMNIKVKYPLKTFKYTQINIYTIIGYSHYTNTDNNAYDIDFVDEGWPMNSIYGNTPPNKLNGSGEARINIPYAGIGIDYTLFTDHIRNNSFSAGFDINVSSIFGRYYNNKSDGNSTFSTLRANYRIGLGISIQNNLRLSKLLGITAGSRLMLNNVLLKDSKASDEKGYVFLNDKADSSLNKYLNQNRVIGSFNVNIGFIIYL